MEGSKSLKQYAKEAKMRLKGSFWQDYKNKIEVEVEKVDDENSKSKVVQYYQTKAAVTIRGVKTEDEEFYLKVKEILSTLGDVSDAIGRLTDKEYFNSLEYNAKQKYLLELSAKYRNAKERYYKEIQYENSI